MRKTVPRISYSFSLNIKNILKKKNYLGDNFSYKHLIAEFVLITNKRLGMESN